MIKVKRFSNAPSDDDGERFLIERLWPRGLTREVAAVSGWYKNLAHTTALHRWFGHDPERWGEFQEWYAVELQAADRQVLLHQLAAAADWQASARRRDRHLSHRSR